MSSCELVLSDFRVLVHLGWTEAERKHAQSVSVRVEFVFKVPPLATETDELSDSVCYAKVAELIQAVAEKKPFRLIEHFAACIYKEIREHFKSLSVQLSVTVTKPHPPLPGLHGGASFHYTEN